MALVLGNSARNTLRGTSGIDQIYGKEGDDLIIGSLRADLIDGGEGRDMVSYIESTAAVTVDLRQVVQYGGHADGDQLYSIENVIGSKYADYLHASETTILLEGGRGADTIYGWQGHGTASYAGSSSSVQIDLNVVVQRGGDAEGDQLYGIHDVLGSAFDDRIFGGFSANDLYGGGGNDLLRGGTSSDRIDGGEGRDTLMLDAIDSSGATVTLDDGTGAGYALYGIEQDTLISIENVVGTDFFEFIEGSNADNNLSGMGGIDTLKGKDGADELRGGFGGDFLYGEIGDDRLFGDPDNDFLSGGAGRDQLDGGDGIDTADYTFSPSGVTVSLTPSVTNSGGDAAGDTLTRIENLIGSDFDDRLTGDGLGNVLEGGRGNDALRGGGGRDLLKGGRGDDTLSGGIDGALDTFRFELIAEGGQKNIGNDTIIDWERIDRVEIVYGSGEEVHLAQVGSNAVITIDGVIGSITVQNALASDFDYLL